MMMRMRKRRKRMVLVGAQEIPTKRQRSWKHSARVQHQASQQVTTHSHQQAGPRSGQASRQ
jgi:hypothetical protein